MSASTSTEFRPFSWKSFLLGVALGIFLVTIGIYLWSAVNPSGGPAKQTTETGEVEGSSSGTLAKDDVSGPPKSPSEMAAEAERAAGLSRERARRAKATLLAPAELIASDRIMAEAFEAERAGEFELAITRYELADEAFAHVSRTSTQRIMTQNNLKSLGMSFFMYADKSDSGLWPPLGNGQNRWALSLATLYPEHIDAPRLFVSGELSDYEETSRSLEIAVASTPPDWDLAEQLLMKSFAYLGYAITTEADFHLLAGILEQQRKSGGAGTTPIEVEGKTFHFLHGKGSDKFSDAENRAKQPVLVDVSKWRLRGDNGEFYGCNVLFADGHVELVKHGDFPAVDSVLDELCGY